MSLLCAVLPQPGLLCSLELLKYSYGCVMILIDPQSEAGQKLKALRDSIPDEDLAGKGREDEPHVTVRYGITDTDSETSIASYLADQAPFTITLGPTFVFPPTENSDNAAVVCVSVTCPAGEQSFAWDTPLHRINAELAENGNFKQADFDYTPHLTLAYVRPDAADKWAGDDSVAGTELVVNARAIHSKDDDAAPLVVMLTGEPPIEDADDGVTVLDEEDESAEKIAKGNPNHEPAGSPVGGEFASGAGAAIHESFRREMKLRGLKEKKINETRSEFANPHGVVVNARFAPAVPAFGSYKAEPAHVAARLSHKTNDTFKGYKELSAVPTPARSAAASSLPNLRPARTARRAPAIQKSPPKASRVRQIKPRSPVACRRRSRWAHIRPRTQLCRRTLRAVEEKSEYPGRTTRTPRQPIAQRTRMALESPTRWRRRTT